MAEPTKEDNKKKPRRRKAPVTIREKAAAESAKKAKPKKSAKVRAKVVRPVKSAYRFGQKEYHPLKLPEKKGIRHLNKRVRFIPKWLSSSWAELRQVTWPTKKEAANKTLAVIIFSLVFAVFVQLLDTLFSKVVKEIILR